MESKRSLEYLMAQTIEARQDPFLVGFMVANATSREQADERATINDYPTHTCRQARLLFDIRQYHPDVWEKCYNPTLGIFKDGIRYDMHREFPCTWETHSYGEMDEGTEGTLIVERNTEKPAIFWDYTLLDADREIVCYSKNLGRDSWHRDKKKWTFLCFLNYGSRSLPKRETVLSFSFRNPHEFKVEREGAWGKATWSRNIVDEKEGYIKIQRQIIPGTQADRIYTATLTPFTSDEREKFLLSEGSWKLSLSTHIVKLDQNRQGRINSDLRFFHTLTSTYEIPPFDENNCFPQNKIWRAPSRKIEQKSVKSELPWDIALGVGGIRISTEIIDGRPGVSVSAKLRPNETDTTEEILASIHRTTPAEIHPRETIERMCDFRRLHDYVYGSPRSIDVPVSMLVTYPTFKK
ncbi:MAG: hypothetical protein Greene07144_1068 [Parcubacteria group bacterium Greene0714_4]|nr:MAG: hypothetical protein Greene07144_1068 [Parcubacteria group bacterium Greene0714_4]